MTIKSIAATALAVAVLIPGVASALPIINGGFDDTSGGYTANSVGNSPGGTNINEVGTAGKPTWAVFDEIAGWKKSVGTSGIEIQSNATNLGGAHSGNLYVELDSEKDANNLLSNSGMYQDVFLAAGAYILEFWYRARTTQLDTNGIRVTLSSTGSISPDPFAQEVVSNDTVNWQKKTFSFDMISDNSVRLEFFARGQDDERGGFLDSVSIYGDPSAVPIPASGLLLAAAFAGAAGLSRRRKAA